MHLAWDLPQRAQAIVQLLHRYQSLFPSPWHVTLHTEPHNSKAMLQGRACSVSDIKKSPTISKDANSVSITKVKRFEQHLEQKFEFWRHARKCCNACTDAVNLHIFLCFWVAEENRAVRSLPVFKIVHFAILISKEAWKWGWKSPPTTHEKYLSFVLTISILIIEIWKIRNLSKLFLEGNTLICVLIYLNCRILQYLIFSFKWWTGFPVIWEMLTCSPVHFLDPGEFGLLLPLLYCTCEDNNKCHEGSQFYSCVSWMYVYISTCLP